MDATYWRSLVVDRFAGRPWITADSVLVPAAGAAKRLVELGADRALAIGASRGTGPLPDSPRISLVDLGRTSPDMMSAVRDYEVAMAALPAEVEARIAAFDPEGAARVVGPMYAVGAPIAGRRFYGPRRPEWLALEDKTVVDALWDTTGVTRAPSTLAAPSLAALTAAAAPLDRGQGTIWAGDSREGFNGGASYIRWVRDAEHAAAATEFFSARCDRVRVMPFLEGVPCSIHGFVFEDHVAALRPCEMVVLRVPGSAQLSYAAAATFWDPPAADRAQMRAMARRVGAHLRAAHGYRGVFTIDGVMTVDGFRPTELNPRFGAAMGALAGGLTDLPLFLLHLMVVEREPVDFAPEALEALIVEGADAHRGGGGMQMFSTPIAETQTARAARGPEGWHLVEDEAPADVELMVGPSATGGFLRARLVPERTPAGPSVAPRVAEVLAFADQLWDLGLGPREAAREVR